MSPNVRYGAKRILHCRQSDAHAVRLRHVALVHRKHNYLGADLHSNRR
jgi:hypothetical protein